jgi:tungstate transport system permease protein
MAAFGGVISEVGAVLIVGGNIRGQTQVLTTGIVQYVDSGVFGTAMALSAILIFLAFTTNYAMTIIQQNGAGSGEGTPTLLGRRWNANA